MLQDTNKQILMSELSHVDASGKAKMVDVGAKSEQKRIAIASGEIILEAETIKLIQENQIGKGDVLTVAKIAGIQAAKQTAALIPLCHTLILDNVAVELSITEHGVIANSTVKSTGKTGVEMEALIAVSTALLTVYDMCKAVDKNMQIQAIRLISKEKLD